LYLLIAILQATLACPPGDLVRGKPVQGEGVRGYPGVIADGNLLQEGTWWEQPGSAVLTGPQAMLFVDLQQETDLRALVLQGDNNDVYHIDASSDGGSWREIWAAPPVPKLGMRTRWTQLPAPQSARYLRVRGSDGDGFFSVSELRAYCSVPTEWPPHLLAAPPIAWWNPVTLWHLIDNDAMMGIKGGLAGAGTALLLWGFFLRRNGTPNAHKKLRDRLLAGMGVLSLLCFWNLFHFHFDNYLHIWEHYHYFVGSKYFRELGYARLYYCTAVADEEAGVHHKDMTNLVTNQLENITTLDHDSCKSRFTPARWDAFSKDVAYFRRALGTRWETSKPSVLEDHGYNATPVWGIGGWMLSSLGPASSGYVMFLGIVDSLLLLAMWGFVLWAFGWRATCVALIYWGTNYPARYFWNGGAFLRMDWLVASIIGICLVKKGHRAGGGAALTYAALLRIFPGFIVVGLILKALARMVRERRWVLSKEHWQFAKGCIAALLILIPLSSALAGGFEAWVGGKTEQGFIENSKKHLHTPLTNNMGLKTIVAYEYGNRAFVTRNNSLADPFGAWKDARNRAFERRKILFGLLVVGFLVLLGWAAEKQEDWVALCLGVGLIPVATELTCYYYSICLAFGFLCLVREELGIGTTLLAALSCVLVPIWGWYDEQFTWISLLYIGFCVWTCWTIGKSATSEVESNYFEVAADHSS
jgi:hypothetical protein